MLTRTLCRVEESESRSVRLSSSLCNLVEQRFARRFSSLEELLTVVLEELACDHSVEMDQAEQRMLEDRLRQLGYL